MSTDRFRAVVVGGHIGRMHAQGYTQSERTDLVAVCDLDPSTLQQFGDEFDVESRYTDFETMLREESPDIVSIGTPQAVHARLTILAATKYPPKAIISEKAMASNMGEAQAMVSACDRNDVKLVIGHQGRWALQNERARELIQSGAIGDVILVHATSGKPNAGLMNIATHKINYVQYVLGDPSVAWVIANVQRETDRYERGWPAEDLAGALIAFESGARLIYESDLPPINDPDPSRVLITGTDGVLRVGRSQDGSGLRMLRDGADGWEDIPVPADSAVGARTREIDAAVAWANGEIDEHRGDAHLTLQTQEILMSIYESARTHTLVRMPLRTMASPLLEAIAAGDLKVKYPGRYDVRHSAALPDADGS